jgi:hypothetical protein
VPWLSPSQVESQVEAGPCAARHEAAGMTESTIGGSADFTDRSAK